MSGPQSGSRGQRIRQLLAAVVLLGIALVLITVYLWTAPMGLVWHLFHGRFATFEGHRIRVPWDFLVFPSDSGGLIIMRPAPDYRLFDSPAGQIFVHRTLGGRGVPMDLSNDYERISSRLVKSQESIGYRLQSVRELSIGNKLGYCWEFLQPDLRNLSIFCSFDRDTLQIEFDGSPKYREKFHSIVTDLTEGLSKAER